MPSLEQIQGQLKRFLSGLSVKQRLLLGVQLQRDHGQHRTGLGLPKRGRRLRLLDTLQRNAQQQLPSPGGLTRSGAQASPPH